MLMPSPNRSVPSTVTSPMWMAERSLRCTPRSGASLAAASCTASAVVRRRDRAQELDQQPVAQRLEDAPAARGDQRVDVAAQGAPRRQHVLLVGFDLGAEVHNVESGHDHEAPAGIVPVRSRCDDVSASHSRLPYVEEQMNRARPAEGRQQFLLRREGSLRPVTFPCPFRIADSRRPSMGRDCIHVRDTRSASGACAPRRGGPPCQASWTWISISIWTSISISTSGSDAAAGGATTPMIFAGWRRCLRRPSPCLPNMRPTGMLSIGHGRTSANSSSIFHGQRPTTRWDR